MVVDTAKRRERINQLVQNSFPGCEAIFLKAKDGALAFRIRAASGRYRSGVVKLLAHHAKTRLNKAWLERGLKRHGGPTAA